MTVKNCKILTLSTTTQEAREKNQIVYACGRKLLFLWKYAGKYDLLHENGSIIRMTDMQLLHCGAVVFDDNGLPF